MYLNELLLGYKLGRFIFSISFLISYFLYISITKINFLNFPLTILIIYSLTSFILILYREINIFEFLLDIIFITVFIVSSFQSIYYLSLLYLFPIFFYGVLSGKKLIYSLAIASLLLYIFIRFTFAQDELYDLILPSFLHGFSFFIISFASISLNKRLKKQEEEIQKLEEEKKKTELYKKLYELSANIAHEIKNPLASISGAAQLMKTGKINDKLINIIYKESKRVDNLLKDFLNLSNPYIEEPKNINIKSLIKEIINLYDDEKKYVKLNANIDNIKINKKAIRSILENLIKNAIYWCKEKIEITVKKENNTLKIIIEDDGKGVEENIKEKIFDPFFSTRHDGTGLGLAIAKNVAINMGGDIFIEKSEKLGGAKFIVEVPVKDESFNY